MAFENSIFAIVSISRLAVAELAEGVTVQATISDGLNGTCFFISANEFMTANHVMPGRKSAENLYFLIGVDGTILYDAEVKEEHPDNDVTVGVVPGSMTDYLSLAQQAEPQADDKLLSYGFACEKHTKLEITLTKRNGKITIKLDSPLHLEKIESTFVGNQPVTAADSPDGIKLRNTNTFLTEPELPKGFSGGPTINIRAGEVIGVTCMVGEAYNRTTNESRKLQLLMPVMKNLSQ